MTPFEAKALDYVRDTITRTGVSPSYEEIAHAIGAGSKSHAHRVIECLIIDGKLRRGAIGKRRSLELIGVNLRSVATDDLVAELARRGVSVG